MIEMIFGVAISKNERKVKDFENLANKIRLQKIINFLQIYVDSKKYYYLSIFCAFNYSFTT